MLAQIELESQKERQKEKTELLKQKFDEIENERNRLVESEEENNFTKKETILEQVRKLENLISSFDLSLQESYVSRQYRSLWEIRSELDSIWQHTDQILLANTNQVKWSNSFLLNPPKRDGFDFHFAPTGNVESESFFLEEMRRKLRNIRETRTSSLENTSKFLISLRKKEKEHINR